MGAPDIVHPPDMHGPFETCSRLMFSADFLASPPALFTVKLPDIPDIGDDPRDDGYYEMAPEGFKHLGWIGWPKDTTVTFETKAAKVIWVLTGVQQTLATTTIYEGAWPD